MESQNQVSWNVLQPFTIFTIFNVINLQSYYVNEIHDYIISIQDHPRIWWKAHRANSNEYIIVKKKKKIMFFPSRTWFESRE